MFSVIMQKCECVCLAGSDVAVKIQRFFFFTEDKSEVFLMMITWHHVNGVIIGG